VLGVRIPLAFALGDRLLLKLPQSCLKELPDTVVKKTQKNLIWFKHLCIPIIDAPV
jgi:hypothetical protein